MRQIGRSADNQLAGTVSHPAQLQLGRQRLLLVRLMHGHALSTGRRDGVNVGGSGHCCLAATAAAFLLLAAATAAAGGRAR